MKKLMEMFNLKKVVRIALKDEKGLTLMEVLAVLVILGILSGIAVLNADGLIGGSKEKAHRSNAHMIVDAAKYKMKSDRPFDTGATTVTYTLQELLDANYLDEAPENPTRNGETYDTADSFVTITRSVSVGTTTGSGASAVTTGAGAITFESEITLHSTEATATKYFDGVSEDDIDTEEIPK